MKDKIWAQKSIWISAFLGASLFVIIYGVRVLDPQYTSWLYAAGADLTQHHLGWMAFRNSGWSFPVGLTDQLSYPEKISIVFTDSIPLFAVAFKLLASVLYRLFAISLPENFQYFGLFGIITFSLNGAFSAKLLKKYLKNDLQIILGSVFFILSFQVLERMFFHTALSAHWMILLSIYPLIYRKELSTKRKISLWILSGFLCSSVHLYYFAMCGAVLVGFIYLDFVERKQLAIFKRCAIELTYFLSYVLTTIFTTFILGGFTGAFHSYSDGLRNNRSFNLNGFYNSQGKGLLLPSLPSLSGQYEGFAYLGLGMLLLLSITLIELIRMKAIRKLCQTHTFICGCIIFGISMFLSLSPKITLGEKVLLEFPLPKVIENLWATFRSTGRIIWVCIYLLFLFALCADYRIISPRKKTTFIIIALCIQLIDLTGEIKQCHVWSKEITYEHKLESNEWDSFIEKNHIKHMLFTFDYKQTVDYPLTIYALEHDITTNDFYFARNYDSARIRKQGFLEYPQDETLYLWKANNTLDCPDYDLYYFQLSEHYIAGIKKNSDFPEDTVEVGYYIFPFDGKYLSQGLDNDNVRYLYPKGTSSSPYIYLPEGIYELRVDGNEIDKLSYQIDVNCESAIELTSLYTSDSEQVFQLVCKEDIWNFKFLIENTANTTVTIENIRIERCK